MYKRKYSSKNTYLFSCKITQAKTNIIYMIIITCILYCGQTSTNNVYLALPTKTYLKKYINTHLMKSQ